MKARLSARIRIASFMQLPEKTFFERIRELERDPLFRKLAGSPDTGAVIRCRRFPRARYASDLLPLEEGAHRDDGGLDVESLLDAHRDAIALIRKIGQENFERYFLYAEDALSSGEIGERCGLPENGVDTIVDFIDDLSVHAEFFHPSCIRFESRVAYRKVAAIEYDEQGEAVIRFFSPRYCSGKYVIDYDRFEALKRGGALSSEEKAGIPRLFRELELVNARKTNLYRLLFALAGVQEGYFRSGDDRLLVPYTQKEMAGSIGIDESLVCRTVAGRSIVTPQGIERPLKDFFPSRKDRCKRLVREILEQAGRRLTDEDVRHVLKERFGIDVSRRTVNACRERG